VPVEAVYAAYTADVTVSANTEAGATVVVTAAPFTPNGTTDYWVEFFCPQCVPANADFIVICVFDNGVFLTRLGVHAAATNNNGVITPRIRLDGANRPTAISHTYSIRALRGATNGTLKAGAGFGAGILAPGFIDVYKII
jgi:hypothetical protein